MDEGSDESAVPTEFAGVAEADTQSAYAWGLDDGEDEPDPQRRWPTWVTAGAVAASLAVVGGAAWVAAPHLHGTQAAPVPLPPVVAAPAAPSKPVAAPPVTVTVTPPLTVTAAAEPSMRPDDAFFIELLTKDGLKPADPRKAIAAGAAKCWEIQNGTTRGRAALNAQDAGMSYEEAVKFTADAISAYCPHAGL